MKKFEIKSEGFESARDSSIRMTEMNIKKKFLRKVWYYDADFKIYDKKVDKFEKIRVYVEWDHKPSRDEIDDMLYEIEKRYM